MSQGTNIVLAHVPTDALRADTAKLRDDLRAEGIIESPRFVQHGFMGGCTVSTRMSADERAAIDAFVAAKGVRKFPPADTGQDLFLCEFLRALGFKVQRNCGDGARIRAPFFIDDKPYNHEGFVAFVNEVRAGFGMMHLGTAKAA